VNIGIDLGTTNSALAYIDPREAEELDFPPIHVLDIPQLVAPGRIEPRRTLPSFLYLGGAEPTAGVYAREQGALVPTQSVYAAKSWLSNSEVDRTAKILPWDAQEGGRVLSPVEASTRYLAHIGEAWRQAMGSPIGEHDVVLTVPASFDEEARELTVTAARAAGIERLTLIEEPAAAFYSWISSHLAQSQKNLFDGQVVLICDVGGGTSDFTLIKVSRTGDRVDFTRTDVGRHLLLGGDNLDLTLAWLVESKLGRQLSLRQRSGLRRQCAAAKERLLADPTLPSVEITVLGAGSSLVGGTLKTEITREEALELALEGFLPFCELAERPSMDKKSVFRELGLPYESDPAVTKHLAAFLGSTGSAGPDAILFNGGFFIPEVLRGRVCDVLEQWYGRRPLVLNNFDLDLAVAVGAAYYSRVRSTGSGVLVRGGLPRAYFVGLGGAQDTALRTVCLVPRGTEDGSKLELDREGLQLVANKPVSFRLYSSLLRTEDQLGELVEFPGEEAASLHQHAPLEAVIRFGNPSAERLIPVKLRVHLTEVGTVEIWADSKVSEHQWRLQFELRKKAATQTTVRPAAVVREEALAAARELVEQAFSPQPPFGPEELPQKLEQALGLGRMAWPVSAIRKLADTFLAHADGRKRGPAFEVRWLNLCGFCLRPGFGFPGDDLRIEQARRVYAGGLAFANQVQNEIEWWIFWGRVAGGLNRNQQTDVFQRIAPNLLPRGQKKAPRLNTSLLRELWRTASSLELLPLGVKTELGDALIRKIKGGDFRETDFWCLSRLGARQLFHGPNNLTVAPAVAARWVESVAKLDQAAEAMAAIARHTGDAARDLPGATLDLVRKALARHPKSAHLTGLMEGAGERDLGRVFGEELPSGLVLDAGGPGDD